MDTTAHSLAVPLVHLAQAEAKAEIPDYLTVDDIAAKIRASRQFVYKEIETGRLECDRFGALIRVTPPQFQAWRARQPKKNPKAA
jgi:excisionase family DNA binding protein